MNRQKLLKQFQCFKPIILKKIKKDEKAYEIQVSVEKILGYNQVSYQKGQGLKIKSPDQMVRLPNTLAQLKA